MPDIVHYDVDPHGVMGDGSEWKVLLLCAPHTTTLNEFTNKVELVTCDACNYLLGEIYGKVSTVFKSRMVSNG